LSVEYFDISLSVSKIEIFNENIIYNIDFNNNIKNSFEIDNSIEKTIEFQEEL